VKHWANNIGQHLAKLRLRRGLTQDQLTAKLQIKGYPMTRQIIANIEARRTNVSEEQIRHLVDVLRCSYDELLDGTTPATNVKSGPGSNRHR
jgi:transcriptional regulator with XRE-family HTH domain